MDFLALCNAVASDSGTLSGETALSTVVGQTGRPAKIVRWTREAYIDLQNARRDWNWLRFEFSGSTVAATVRYSATSFIDVDSNGLIDRFGAWIMKGDETEDRYTIYDPAIGLTDKGRLRFLMWDEFYRHRLNTAITSDRPAFFSIDPQNRLCLSPTPDKAYTILGPYRKSAQRLAANSDVPEMPADFHSLIVRFAVQALDKSDEEYARIKMEDFYKNMQFQQLVQMQLPTWTFAGPLA